jgi:hypothetical protein
MAYGVAVGSLRPGTAARTLSSAVVAQRAEQWRLWAAALMEYTDTRTRKAGARRDVQLAAPGPSAAAALPYATGLLSRDWVLRAEHPTHGAALRAKDRLGLRLLRVAPCAAEGVPSTAAIPILAAVMRSSS